MAISATSVSPKDFQLGIIKEATAGTAVTSSMNLINIDSLELPALNPIILYLLNYKPIRVITNNSHRIILTSKRETSSAINGS